MKKRELLHIIGQAGIITALYMTDNITKDEMEKRYETLANDHLSKSKLIRLLEA